MAEPTPSLLRAYRRMFLADDGRLTSDGRLVLEDLAGLCDPVGGIPVDAQNRGDPLALAYRAGRSDVIGIIRHRLQDDPGRYLEPSTGD